MFRFISSVESIDRAGLQGDVTHKSADILWQSFLQDAIVISSDMGRDAHSLMLSIQHFLCQLARMQKRGFRDCVPTNFLVREQILFWCCVVIVASGCTPGHSYCDSIVRNRMLRER